jgi:hypothetical protein
VAEASCCNRRRACLAMLRSAFGRRSSLNKASVSFDGKDRITLGLYNAKRQTVNNSFVFVGPTRPGDRGENSPLTLACYQGVGNWFIRPPSHVAAGKDDGCISCLRGFVHHGCTNDMLLSAAFPTSSTKTCSDHLHLRGACIASGSTFA